GAKVRVETEYLGPAEKPIGEGDTMAAQIEQCPATRALYIPEPLRMRTEVLLALLNQMHFAEGARVCHFLRLGILRREEELLRVEQQHPVRAARLDHPVGLVEGDTEGLL